MEWVHVALASLMVISQTALASFMDSAVLDLFWRRAMPSFQTNFCQWASMVDLVANSFPRALLASSQRWPASMGGALPLGPGVSAVGQGEVGISPRKASPLSASSGVLTWDDVSTGPESLWGRGVSMTMGFSLFGVEFPMHVQMCLILPGIGAASLPWSCWLLFLPLSEWPWWGWPMGWRGKCQRVALSVLTPWCGLQDAHL